jgi:hypothetical protein
MTPSQSVVEPLPMRGRVGCVCNAARLSAVWIERMGHYYSKVDHNVPKVDHNVRKVYFF